MDVNGTEENTGLEFLLRKASKDKTGNSWEAVKSKLQMLETMPENDEVFGYLEDFEFAVMPPDILKTFIRVMHKSSNDVSGIGILLRNICENIVNLSFDYVRVAFENFTEEEMLEMDVYGENERYERNNSILMLILDDKWKYSLNHLRSAHLLVTKYPALLHMESFGDSAGEHFQGTLHPMSKLPELVQVVVQKCADDDLAVGHIRDYWFPIHSIWCDELGVSNSSGDRFLRMLFDLVTAGANKLLKFMCKKEMWDLPHGETARVWKGILKSELLGEKKVILEWVAPMLGVTSECVVFARERNRSTFVINALIQSNPGVCADAAVECKEPSEKRVKTE